jgi:hypothetical protein
MVVVGEVGDGAVFVGGEGGWAGGTPAFQGGMVGVRAGRPRSRVGGAFFLVLSCANYRGNRVRWLVFAACGGGFVFNSKTVSQHSIPRKIQP